MPCTVLAVNVPSFAALRRANGQGFETQPWAAGISFETGMKTHTILLVEDNADDAELAIRAFERTQMRNAIVLARDGGEALEYLFATGRYAEPPPVPPDVVLLDLNLPRIDGLEVLRRARQDQRTRRLPIVVMTSSREAGDIGRCYELGANSYVRKPVDFSQFVQAIHQVGAYWLRLNEPAPRS